MGNMFVRITVSELIIKLFPRVMNINSIRNISIPLYFHIGNIQITPRLNLFHFVSVYIFCEDLKIDVSTLIVIFVERLLQGIYKMS